MYLCSVQIFVCVVCGNLEPAWVDNITGTSITVKICQNFNTYISLNFKMYLSTFQNVFVSKYLSVWHLGTWVDNITGTSLRDTCTSQTLSPHHCSNIQPLIKVSPITAVKALVNQVLIIAL